MTRAPGCSKAALGRLVLLGQLLIVIPAVCDESFSASRVAEIPLPTPRTHYEKIKPGTTGLPLLLVLVQELDPETQQTVLAELHSPEANELLGFAQTPGSTKLPKVAALTLFRQLDWTVWGPLLLEFMVHESQVLEIIPTKYQPFWTPIVHDALLYFLDHFPKDRLLEKLADIAYSPEISRTENLLAFLSKTPSLQKVGQILARNPALSPEYQAALQQLENNIQTMSREELVQFITDDIGKAHIDQYQVEFADTILAEASVGAVIRVTCVPPGSPVKVDAICKVIKPYALVNLPLELEILDQLASYFTRQHDFYQLGSMPLVQMFKDTKKALTDEINIVNEQQNLARAGQYYRDDKNVVVPELYPISTNHVTFMKYITGEKITSAFEGQPKERAILAKRLFDVMTSDVIFAKSKDSIFHGDPHAGNVFHVTGDAQNRYRIALLDWGLYGTFPREERVALMQLVLGVLLKDAKRLHKNVGALLENGMPQSPEEVKTIDAIISHVLEPNERGTSFDVLAQLLAGLVNQGFATKFSLNLFIKSQVTIAGILEELDPELDQNEYLMQHVKRLVKREIPKRILCTLWFPAWDSHSYRSLLSNQDVWDTRKIPKNKTKGRNRSTTLSLPRFYRTEANALP